MTIIDDRASGPGRAGGQAPGGAGDGGGRDDDGRGGGGSGRGPGGSGGSGQGGPGHSGGGHGGGGQGGGGQGGPGPATSTKTAAPPLRNGVDTEILQNVALTALTVATALCMRRLFSDWSYLGPTLLAAIGAHAVGWAARRRNAPAMLGVAAQLGVGALVVSWIVVPEATFYGIPTSTTWHAVQTHVNDAFRQFREVTAPAPVSSGFVIATVVGVVLVATLSDWAAFRMRAPIEAVIPSFALFIFTAALGSSHYRPLSIAVELGAMLAFLFAYSTGPRARASAWFASRSTGGLSALARPALVLGVVTVAAALIVGPSLPGASSAPIIDWKTKTDGPGGKSSRTTVSPFVSIRERLVQQSGTPVFTVRSPARSYWRLTSLDTFDGTVWSSNDSYRSVRNNLGRASFEPAAKDATTVTQEFTISGLSSIWLPAAFRPVQIRGASDVSYNSQSGSLISDQATSDGDVYTVTSAIPTLNPQELAAVPPVTSDDVALQRFLALPSISARVLTLARQLTNGKVTEYDKAKALQDYLRSPIFRYDLNAPAGHGNDALARFLFQTRRGYCEQFAGSFAVMARAIGLPTRVAVGFTTGDLEGDNLYHVLDDHAHAWPEVFFPTVGWVAFEPTPGRGNPQAQSYTNVPESQANVGSGDGSSATTTPTTAASVDPTGATGSTVRRGETDPSTTTAKGGRAGRDVTDGLVVVLIALVALLVWAAVIPGVRAVRRSRRRRRAGEDTAALVLTAWADANDALALAGAGRRASETLEEHAARTARTDLLDAPAQRALATLAGDASAASYAGSAVPDAVAERAAVSAAEVQSAVRSRASRSERLRWIVDPRTLLKK